MPKRPPPNDQDRPHKRPQQGDPSNPSAGSSRLPLRSGSSGYTPGQSITDPMGLPLTDSQRSSFLETLRNPSFESQSTAPSMRPLAPAPPGYQAGGPNVPPSAPMGTECQTAVPSMPSFASTSTQHQAAGSNMPPLPPVDPGYYPGQSLRDPVTDQPLTPDQLSAFLRTLPGYNGGPCARCCILGEACERGTYYREETNEMVKSCRRCFPERVPCTENREEAELIYGPLAERPPIVRETCFRCHLEGLSCSSTRKNPCKFCWRSRVLCVADRDAMEADWLRGVNNPPAGTYTSPCARCLIMGAECTGGSPCNRCWSEEIDCRRDLKAAEQIHGQIRGSFAKTYEEPCEGCKEDDGNDEDDEEEQRGICSMYHWPCLKCWKEGKKCVASK